MTAAPNMIPFVTYLVVVSPFYVCRSENTCAITAKIVVLKSRKYVW